MLGLSEREYYTNSPYVNFCKQEGYHDGQDFQTQLFRNLAGVVHGSMGGKQSIKEIWPMWYDSISSKLIMTDELKEKILIAHGLKKLN